MDIQTVKNHGAGYLVNSALVVPVNPNNKWFKAVQKWIDQGNTAEPEFTAAEKLDNEKRDKLQELRAEGLSRIQVEIPAITDWDTLELVRELWLSIKPTSRQATVPLTNVINIYQAGRDEVAVINGFGTLTAVRNYNVITDPQWP